MGAEYVGFNAYPAGAAGFEGGSNAYKYACFLQPMSINAKNNNGYTPVVQLDYNQAGIRMIQKSRNYGTAYQYSVRCVKNYEHYDLK